MSLARCDKCDHIVDTDDDPECYHHEDSDLESWDGCMCQWCREKQPEAEKACYACAGTGIGRHGDPDTSRCYACKGRGYIVHDDGPDPDDERDKRRDDRMMGDHW